VTERAALPLSARLPFPALIALRYLRSTRRDSFISFLSLVAIGSIALGVATLIVALAALSGFQHELKAEILGRTPAVRIDLPAEADVVVAARSVGRIPGVVATRRIASGRGWLVAGDRVRPVAIEGYEGTVPETFSGASGIEPGLYVAEGLANNWFLEAGDELELVSNRPGLTPLGPQPRTVRLPLAGTFVAGRTEQVERIAVPIDAARRLLAPLDERLSVSTADLEVASEVAARAAEVLPEGSTVASWRDLNRPLVFALRLEKAVMFVAVFLIVVVGALALVSDLNLIISAKRGEIGMLAAMGARDRDLRRAFLILAAMMVSFGGGVGAAVGLLVAWALDAWRVVNLPSQVYFVDYVPFLIRPGDVAVVLGGTALLALSFAWSAAGRAARTRPVEALRR
jgi:lipoprotein-releasing system permease protein